jgi:hypothetical protein
MGLVIRGVAPASAGLGDEWLPDAELPSYFDEPVAGAGPAESLWACWRRHLDPDEDFLLGPAGATTVEPAYLRPPERLGVTFLRAVDLPFRVTAVVVESWWRREARSGVLALGPGRLIGAPVFEPTGGQYRWLVRAARSWPWPDRCMDLDLFPWLGTWGTKLHLRPRRAVHGTSSYFRVGHQLLDDVVQALHRQAGELSLTGACSASEPDPVRPGRPSG